MFEFHSQQVVFENFNEAISSQRQKVLLVGNVHKVVKDKFFQKILKRRRKRLMVFYQEMYS